MQWNTLSTWVRERWITSSVILLLPLLSIAQPPGQRLTSQDYINLWHEEAKRQMRAHGIPASITLAQGLLESGNGNSRLATQGNNHFGIKCHDWKGRKIFEDDDRKHECFRKYRDASESYSDHSDFLKKRRYEPLFALKITDYKGWARGLKKAGYATDPRYPSKLIDLIERFDLAQYDKEVLKGGSGRKGKKTKPKKHVPEEKREVEEVIFDPSQSIAFQKHPNNIKFVRARDGQTLRSVADELEMTVGMLAKWNDLAKNATLEADQVIFTQPKRSKAKDKQHVVVAGETLHGISQMHGIKLKKMCAYNGLSTNDAVSAGQVLVLRKPSK